MMSCLSTGLSLGYAFVVVVTVRFVLCCNICRKRLFFYNYECWNSHAWSSLGLSYFVDSLMVMENGHAEVVVRSTLGPISRFASTRDRHPLSCDSPSNSPSQPFPVFPLCLALPPPSLSDTLPCFLPNSYFQPKVCAPQAVLHSFRC